MTKQLTHIRYIIYLDSNHQKKVAFWSGKEIPIHPDYAREHHIPIADFCAGGYIGAKDDQWLIYEHYPVSEEGKERQEFNKRLVMSEFKKSPQYTDDVLKQEVSETYRQEKHLLLFAIKEMFSRG